MYRLLYSIHIISVFPHLFILLRIALPEDTMLAKIMKMNYSYS